MMKKLQEFTNHDDWVNYVMDNMRNIEVKRTEEKGVEILLITKRGVIGKWNNETNYGYIEEYRGDVRLNEELKKNKS